MKINDLEVVGKQFVYDGCHKIYIIENEQDKKHAIEAGYSENDFFDISKIENIYWDSCSLRFIYNWELSKFYVEQFEQAKFY